MQVHTFIAESAAEAVEQIRQELGPQAVVLNVRKLPVEGLARLWQRPRIEVLATLPEQPPATAATDVLAELRQELAEIKQKVSAREAATKELPVLPAPRETYYELMSAGGELQPPRMESPSVASGSGKPNAKSGWRVGALLESSGLAQVHVQRVLDEIRNTLGDQPPESVAAELDAARTVLIGLWRYQKETPSNRHVFVGSPGVGKTTVLSKWLAQKVLVEGRRARVWRLDGQTANTAESLSVFAEILGVAVDRFRPQEDPDPAELVFVDLPGVNWKDPAALTDLARRLEDFPDAEVHLVLNAAYEGQLLLAQGRAFGTLPVNDVILTHIDEEPRWGKLWNFVLGTNYTVSYLSAGQNLPGDFQPADPERVLSRFMMPK